MTRIWSIQYLRALAALAVVLFHVLQPTSFKLDIGAAGVDVFFVISGFIMGVLTIDQDVSASSFLWRRLIRIAPLYWAATAATLAIVALRPSFFHDVDASAGNIVRSALFLPTEKDFPVVQQGWTLVYEMFFYALLAASLAAPRALRFALLAAALVALPTIGALTAPTGAIARAYTNPLLLEFLAGLCLAALWRAGRLNRPRLGAAAFVIGVGGYALVQTFALTALAPRFVVWGGPAIALVGGALCLEAAGRAPKLAWLAFLGDASYSIYLTHAFVTTALQWIAPNWPVGAVVIVSMSLSIAVGAASYIVFERPVTARLKHLPARAAP